MKNSNQEYVNAPYRDAIMQLIWSSNDSPNYPTTKQQNFAYLLYEIIGIGFHEAMYSDRFDFDEEDIKKVREMMFLASELAEKYDSDLEDWGIRGRSRSPSISITKTTA